MPIRIVPRLLKRHQNEIGAAGHQHLPVGQQRRRVIARANDSCRRCAATFQSRDDKVARLLGRHCCRRRRPPGPGRSAPVSPCGERAVVTLAGRRPRPRSPLVVGTALPNKARAVVSRNHALPTAANVEVAGSAAERANPINNCRPRSVADSISSRSSTLAAIRFLLRHQRLAEGSNSHYLERAVPAAIADPP